MLKLKHTTLVVISGLVWFGIGVYLLQLGLNLLFESVHFSATSLTGTYPLVNFLKQYSGSAEGAMLIVVVISLFIGYLKGRYVLGKSAQKGVQRILSFPNPTSLGNIYSAKYYVLLGGMVALGISVKYLGFTHDVRGLVDVTIGSALINGAMIYFRLLQVVRKNQQETV